MMFPHYTSFGCENEKQELARAEQAYHLAVAAGVDPRFAFEMIDAGEIDFHYATAQDGAAAILDEYRSMF